VLVVPRVEGNVVSRYSNEKRPHGGGSTATVTQRVGVGSGFIVRNPQSISSIRNAIWQMSPGQLHLRSGTYKATIFSQLTVPIYLPTYLPTYLPFYPPTYLPGHNTLLPLFM